MSNLLYYVEMQDKEFGEIADIYGYEKEITVMARGFFKSIVTQDSQHTFDCIHDVVKKLEKVGFVSISTMRININ